VQDPLRVLRPAWMQAAAPSRGGARQRQGAGQDEDGDDRVTVRIHDPGLRSDPPGRLASVIRGRRPRPGIRELPDTGLPDQELRCPAGAGRAPDARHDVRDLAADVPAGLAAVLAAGPAAADPRGMGDSRVKGRRSIPARKPGAEAGAGAAVPSRLMTSR
jgi:hypothetical protein